MTRRAPRRSIALTPQKRETFLGLLAEGWTLSSASKAVGRDRRRIWELRQADPDFDEAVERAIAEGIDRLEDELVRAAVQGWEETDVVEKGGVVVSRITKHRRRPELLARVREWRRPAVDVQVNVGAPLEVEGHTPVGWQDLFRVARECGAAHLLGLSPDAIAPQADVVDAEYEELAEPALPPGPAETEARSPGASLAVPAADAADAPPPKPLSLDELGELLLGLKEVS
jgi:hypothetical protein